MPNMPERLGSNQKEPEIVKSVLTERASAPSITPGNLIQLTEEQLSLATARYILNCVFEDLEKEAGLK